MLLFSKKQKQKQKTKNKKQKTKNKKQKTKSVNETLEGGINAFAIRRN